MTIEVFFFFFVRVPVFSPIFRTVDGLGKNLHSLPLRSAGSISPENELQTIQKEHPSLACSFSNVPCIFVPECLLYLLLALLRWLPSGSLDPPSPRFFRNILADFMKVEPQNTASQRDKDLEDPQ